MKKILLTLFSLTTLLIIQAQNCVINSTAYPNPLDCNDTLHVDLVGYSSVAISDTFCFGGPCDTAWQSTGGAQYDNPYIPSNQGGTYFWMGQTPTPPAALATNPLDVTGGGQICFEFVYADGIQGAYAGGGAPEQPDQYNEGIAVQYSLDGGLTWVDIVYYAPNGDTLPGNPGTTAPTTTRIYETWTEICIDIPPGAYGATTNFRWIQEFNSGSCCDHWGLDNIRISTSDPRYFFILTNPGGGLIGPSAAHVDYLPTTDSTFVFLFTNGINDFCYDTVHAIINPTSAGPDVTVSCSTIGLPLQLFGVNQDLGNVVWSPALGLDDVNAFNPYANPVNDQMYTVTSDCGVDSTFVNVVPIFVATASTLSDSICVNDTSVLVATSDQPLNGYTYKWTNYVQNDTIATPTVAPTINTTYYLEMVSDSGCVRNDSVQIYVGAVPKTINYLGDMRLCRGDSTQITVEAIQPTIFDDFDNNGANLGIWCDIQNGTVNADCGSVSGQTLHFNGTGNRYAQTIPLNVLPSGGTVTFDLIYGGFAAPGTSCNFVGFNENVEFQYSLNGCAGPWVLLTTYGAFPDFTWTNITEVIPAAAAGPNTSFRLVQPLFTGNNTDNWAIDNFLVELDCSGAGCVNYTYDWTPTATVSDPSSLNPFFFPDVTTTYSLSISPEGFNCNSAADVITIEVDELAININPDDTFLCEPATVLLDAEIGSFSNSCDGTYDLSQIPLNTLTSPAPTTIPLLGDDAMSATVTIPFAFEFFCEVKNSFAISSNGFISFTSLDNGCCSGENLPTNNAFNPNDLIALMWADLNNNTGSAISHFVSGAAPNRVQVIQFTSVPHLGSASNVTGQIQLHETSNIVEIHCADCQTDGGVLTMGIENSTGDIGYTPTGYNATSWSSTNEGWRFIPANSPANYSLLWSPNTAITDITVNGPLVTPLTTTQYVLEVLNINNCAFYDSATVNIFENNTTVSATPNPVCVGSTVQLNATGADTYTWTPGTNLSATNIANPVASANAATGDITYFVEYNTQGCTQTDSIYIDVLPLPTADINNGTSPVEFCEGTTATLEVNNLTGWTYSWTGPETGTGNSIDVTSAGFYTVTYSDGSCTNTSSVTLFPNANPTFDYSSIDTILCCTDDSTEIVFANLVVNGAVIEDVYWNGILLPSNATSETVFSSGNGNVTTNELNILKIVTDKGCETEADLPYISTKCANPVITGPETVYSNTTELFDLTVDDTNSSTTSYTWTTTDAAGNIADISAEDASVSGVTAGNYTLGVTVINTYDGFPCPPEVAQTKDYEVIEVEEPKYPDAFTPKNGDAVNNVYRPVVSSLAVINDFRVYNRWGQLIYDMSTADNKDGWDGTWLGKDQEPDLYLYYMNISLPNEDYVKEGTVTLLR